MWLALLSQQGGTVLESNLGPCSVQFLCLHCFPCVYLSFLPQSKDMCVRLNGDSTLAVGVNNCLSVCVRSATDWRPVQGVLRLVPYDNWDRLQ